MEKKAPVTLWIVCPCFFDVPSYLRVQREVREVVTAMIPNLDLRFVLVDDSAGQDAAIQALSDVLVVTPPFNMGHQAAVVYALRRVSPGVDEKDVVVTMDSDGEDRPSDVPQLVQGLLRAQSQYGVSIARRTKRKESFLFKVSYFFYKFAFRVLTGATIRSGNFVAFRGTFLREVIFHPHFDQCYSSSFISLPLNLILVPLPRGNRFQGKSKMGFIGLATHGLRMLMPFSEKIATRTIMFFSTLLVSSFGLLLASALVFPKTVLMILSGVCLLVSAIFVALGLILFFTFSQTKSRTLRGLNVIKATD